MALTMFRASLSLLPLLFSSTVSGFLPSPDAPTTAFVINSLIQKKTNLGQSLLRSTTTRLQGQGSINGSPIFPEPLSNNLNQSWQPPQHATKPPARPQRQASVNGSPVFPPVQPSTSAKTNTAAQESTTQYQKQQSSTVNGTPVFPQPHVTAAPAASKTNEEWKPEDRATTTPQLLAALWTMIAQGSNTMVRGETQTIVFPEMEKQINTPAFMNRLMGHLEACKDICDSFGTQCVLVPHVQQGTVKGFTLKSYRNPDKDPDSYEFEYDPFWDDGHEWNHEGIDEEMEGGALRDPYPTIVNRIPDDDEEIISVTKTWVDKMMSDMGICPFTSGPNLAGLPMGNVFYCVDRCTHIEDMYARYWKEVVRVEQSDEKELSTTLLIAPEFLIDNIELFETFSNTLTQPLAALGVEDLLQLVFFHPQWTFRDGAERSGLGAAANYARRSAWPMINLLRTKQVRAAQKGIPTGLVYKQNEKTLDAVGTDKLETMLRLRNWSDIANVKVDRKDMEALRVAQDYQQTGVVKEEDMAFAYDSTPAANKVDRSQIEGGNMVNVIKQALERRLGKTTGEVQQLSGPETSAAVMASDFLLEELHRIASDPQVPEAQPMNMGEVEGNHQTDVSREREETNATFEQGGSFAAPVPPEVQRVEDPWGRRQDKFGGNNRGAMPDQRSGGFAPAEAKPVQNAWAKRQVDTGGQREESGGMIDQHGGGFAPPETQNAWGLRQPGVGHGAAFAPQETQSVQDAWGRPQANAGREHGSRDSQQSDMGRDTEDSGGVFHQQGGASVPPEAHRINDAWGQQQAGDSNGMFDQQGDNFAQPEAQGMEDTWSQPQAWDGQQADVGREYQEHGGFGYPEAQPIEETWGHQQVDMVNGGDDGGAGYDQQYDQRGDGFGAPDAQSMEDAWGSQHAHMSREGEESGGMFDQQGRVAAPLDDRSMQMEDAWGGQEAEDGAFFPQQPNTQRDDRGQASYSNSYGEDQFHVAGQEGGDAAGPVSPEAQQWQMRDDGGGQRTDMVRESNGSDMHFFHGGFTSPPGSQRMPMEDGTDDQRTDSSPGVHGVDGMFGLKGGISLSSNEGIIDPSSYLSPPSPFDNNI